MKEAVNHPGHYGGEDNQYEVIKVIEAWEQQNPNLRFNLLTAIKYLGRAGLKDDLAQDLKKARWYIDREITRVTRTKCQECGSTFYVEPHHSNCSSNVNGSFVASPTDALRVKRLA